MEKGKTYHMRLDIKGALINWKLKDFRNMLKDENGRTLSPSEAKMALLEELEKGNKYLPMGPCDNFCMKEHGCMGHDR